MNEITVNGRSFETDADPRTPFLEVLREKIGLKGTKYGCGEGECGACTIIVDGKTVCSCLTLTGSVVGSDVTTIEGMANDPVGTRLVNSFAKNGAVQCGFCTPGFVLSGWALLNRQDEVNEETICDALSGNLCRCTGYVKIIEAVNECAAGKSSSPVTIRKGRKERSIRIGQNYWRPTDLDELTEGLEDISSDAQLVAGGTDLMVQFEHRLHDLNLVDLSGLAELRGISESRNHLRIGATTSWTEIRQSPLVKLHAPVLGLAAAEIGGTQIQNRGTIGGNIANASPAADGLPALYLYDSEVRIRSKHGTRTLPLSEFIVGPGKTRLDPGEVVEAIRIPKRSEAGTPVFFFEKFGTRKAQAITKGSVSFHAFGQNGKLVSPRIALGAVGPTVIRATEAENLLSGTSGETNLDLAKELTSSAAKPIDDLRSTADFRRRLVGGLLVRGLMRLGKDF